MGLGLEAMAAIFRKAIRGQEPQGKKAALSMELMTTTTATIRMVVEKRSSTIKKSRKATQLIITSRLKTIELP